MEIYGTSPRPERPPTYMCEIILTGKVTLTGKAEPCKLLFKSLNVSLLPPSLYVILKGGLPIWQAIASFPQV